jgi:hypothetical protein
MKNIFIAASLLVISCNYKSESDKQFDRVVLMADCTNISTNKALIKLKESTLDAVLGTIKATGKATPEQEKIINSIPLEIDSLNADIDSLKIKIDNQIKQQ